MALTLGVNSGFVTVAPTADPNETGTTIDGSSVVTKHTSPAGATKITSIGWYRASGTNAANWEIALYSDSAGAAGARVAVDNTNSTTSAGWVVTAVDWAISGSTAYWLALQMDAHTGSSSVDGAAAGGAGSDILTSQTTLADPYGGGAVADADGMYAIYALVQITHPTSGTLTGPGSTVTGTASRTSPSVTHATTGTLTGAGSTLDGTAARTRVHATSGTLTGAGSTLAGTADRQDAPLNVTHDTSGVLTGAGSTLAGTASSATTRTTTGVLTGQGSTVTGTAARFRAMSTSGTLVGAGSTVTGTAARVGLPVTHATTGILVGSGSIVAGTSTVVGLAAYRLKYWNGTVWTAKPLKYWDGNAWVQKELKYWDGANWS